MNYKRTFDFIHDLMSHIFPSQPYVRTPLAEVCLFRAGVLAAAEEAHGVLPERQGLRRAHGRRPREEALRLRRLRGSISQEGMSLVRPDSLSMDQC